MHNPIEITTLYDILTIISLIVGLLSIAVSIVLFFYASSSSKKIETASLNTQTSLKLIEQLYNSLSKDAFALLRGITEEMTKYLVSDKVTEQKTITPNTIEDTTKLSTPPPITPTGGTDPKTERFEYIWKHIFKSQIEILEHLQKHGPTKREELRHFFKPILEQQGFNFDLYLRFLLGYNLAISTAEEEVKNQTIRITAFGKEFLDFLQLNKYDKNLKPNL